jgi:hypothetical protein
MKSGEDTVLCVTSKSSRRQFDITNPAESSDLRHASRRTRRWVFQPRPKKWRELVPHRTVWLCKVASSKVSR